MEKIVKTFILVDKQDITRLGISFLLRQPDIHAEIIEKVSTQNEFTDLLEKYQDAVVVLDLAFSDFLSLKTVIAFHERYPMVYWLFFSIEINDELFYQYCTNPCFSFVLKQCDFNEIKAALICAVKGHNFICSSIARIFLQYRKEINDKKERLTTTEREILKLIATGKSAKEIANGRNLSINTVITHKKNIFRKLEVNSVYEATKYALRTGLIDSIEYYI
jgi:DNA-binding NarL/FixJ family response regulator